MILGRISQAKNELQTPKEFGDLAGGYIDNIVYECYKDYQKALENSQSMDFDDLIMLTVKLFQEYPETLSYYQNKFHYIHVDEYQDTNYAQYQLVQLLANKFKTSASSAMRTKASTVGAVLTWRTSSTSKRIIRMQKWSCWSRTIAPPKNLACSQ